jgi:hypothetical protein
MRYAQSKKTKFTELIEAHLIKKFPAFYGTRRFTSVHNPPLLLILNHTNPVYDLRFSRRWLWRMSYSGMWLTLIPLSRIFLPWRWRRYVPPKSRFTQDLHGATSQKTAHIHTRYFFKINFNTVHPSTHRSSMRSLPPIKILYLAISHPSQACYMPARLIFLDMITVLTFG